MDDQKVIDLIKVHPAIYDPTNPNHLNENYIALLWMDIAKQLDTTDAEARTAWENIFCRYMRERRKLIKKKFEGEEDPKSDWPLYESLQFLEQTQSIRFKKKVRICLTDTLIKSEEMDTEGISEMDDEEVGDEPKANKRVRHTHHVNFRLKSTVMKPNANPQFNPSYPQNQVPFNPQDPEPDDEKDQDVMFLRHILPSMRRMSVIDNLEFKFDVMQLMKSKLCTPPPPPPPPQQMGSYCCNYGYIAPVRISANRKT